MISQPNFYSVIIGTELLNGRRQDAHFEFLNQELLKRGWRQKASFVIEDDIILMEKVFKLIKADKNAVMFCFGGIGATPDDYTREIAAKVFTQSQMEFHEEAKQRIINQFQDEAYPHRINMAHLPINAKLLHNVVNNVPGFYLKKQFFFTPGFPSMSQSMVIEALDLYYNKNSEKEFRLTLKAQCGENELIPLMQELPPHIELSSLPHLEGHKRSVELSIAANSKIEVENYFEKFTTFLKSKAIKYTT